MLLLVDLLLLLLLLGLLGLGLGLDHVHGDWLRRPGRQRGHNC